MVTAPIVHNPAHGGFWELRRYADLRAAASDWEVFTSGVPGRVPIPHELEHRSFPQLPLESDRPEHTAYRRMISPFFGRARIESLEDSIRELVVAHLTRACSRAECEAVHEFALPVVLGSLGIALGRPAEDVSRWERWGKEPTLTPWSTRDMIEYIEATTWERHEPVADDFFGYLGTVGRRKHGLSQPEIMGFAFELLAAGRGTTVDAITNGLWHLGRHPEAQEWLRAQPDAIPGAIEELLRHMSPIQFLGRVVSRDTELSGHRFRQGELVALHYGAANRDESVFADAGTCDLSRSPNPHVAFGTGPHVCIGAHLARLQLRVVLEEVVGRATPFRVAEERAVANPLPGGTSPAFEALPVRFRTGSSHGS